MRPSHTHSVTTESDSYPGRRRSSTILGDVNVKNIFTSHIDKKKYQFCKHASLKKWLNLKENNKTICILADEKLCGSQQ
jgi:hypothetical protein